MFAYQSTMMMLSIAVLWFELGVGSGISIFMTAYISLF
jgi:hypothetical protein